MYRGSWPGERGLPYKSDRDAHCLTKGCKLQILVSLKVSIYVPIQVSLGAVHKEIYKKCHYTDHTEFSFRGQFKPEPHSH